MAKAVSPSTAGNTNLRRTVPVDRSLSPAAAIAATGRNRYLADSVVASMPQGKDGTVDIFFILLDTRMNDVFVDKQLSNNGLIAVDPFALMSCNAVEPDFADGHPCFTHWKDAEGKWCYAAFSAWSGEREVEIRQCVSSWGGRWRVAGVLKPS